MYLLRAAVVEGFEMLSKQVDAVGARIIEQLHRSTRKIMTATAQQYDQLIAALNAGTNLVGAHLQKLTDQLAAQRAAGEPATDAQLQSFQAVVDHLMALGADPANPVPAPAPAATSTPVQSPAVIAASEPDTFVQHDPKSPDNTPVATSSEPAIVVTSAASSDTPAQ
jgi:hypothetical protein